MRWAWLFCWFAVGCCVIGYGLLPLLASDMFPEQKIVGAAMVCAGVAFIVYLVLALRERRSR